MVNLMSEDNRQSKKQILILVEGERREVELMEKLFEVYQINENKRIVSYKTNIYVLFNEMFTCSDDVENMDLLQVLKSREKDLEKKKLFDEKYTDILLVFDFDPQDKSFNPDNIMRMQEYFNESTYPGKLYLNYPMIEAFYHLSNIPDRDYNERSVTLQELQEHLYKRRVPTESYRKNYSKFALSKNEYTTVLMQNLAKAYYLSEGEMVNWDKILSKAYYPDMQLILRKQLYFLSKDSLIYVLCTCVFYIVEYNPKLLMD